MLNAKLFSIKCVLLRVFQTNTETCLKNLFSNCAGHQVGNDHKKKLEISILMNKTCIGIFLYVIIKSLNFKYDNEPFVHIENTKGNVPTSSPQQILLLPGFTNIGCNNCL